MPSQVIHVEWGRRWSGGMKQVLMLVRGLRGQGISCFLVSPKGSVIVTRASAQGIPLMVFPLHGDHDLPTWWHFGRWLKTVPKGKGRPIVHVHSRRGAFPTLALAHFLGYPTVLHWRVAASPRFPIFWWADCVIAVSERVAQKVRGAGVPDGKIAVIPGGVDAQDFFPSPDARSLARRRFGIPEHTFVIAAGGRFVPGKGFDVLIKAVAMLPPSERPIVLLAGDGKERTFLEQLAERKGLKDIVYFLGFQGEIRPLLWAADVFVHCPTHFPEGLPNVLLEAMAAGLPVIGSCVGGIPEIIRDGETGLLVSPGDPEGLAEALLRLQRGREIRERLGRSGQLWVKTHHRLEGVITKTLQVYERLVGQG